MCMTKGNGFSLFLSMLSYPIAYLAAAVLYKITYVIHGTVTPLVPIADVNTCIISLVLSLNVFSVLIFVIHHSRKASDK